MRWSEGRHRVGRREGEKRRERNRKGLGITEEGEGGKGKERNKVGGGGWERERGERKPLSLFKLRINLEERERRGVG